jgi:hypothetical protein
VVRGVREVVRARGAEGPMSVSTLTAEEVEPRQRLTTWPIGAASVVMLAGLLFGYLTSRVTLGALVGALIGGGLADTVGRRPIAQIQQRWERGTHRRPHSPRPEKVVA